MHYRLYLLDRNARIVRGVDLECRDDGEAIAEASAYRAGHGVEIWHQRTRVARLDAVPETPALMQQG